LQNLLFRRYLEVIECYKSTSKINALKI